MCLNQRQITPTQWFPRAGNSHECLLLGVVASYFTVIYTVENRTLLGATNHNRVGGHRRAVCTKVKIQTVSVRTS